MDTEEVKTDAIKDFGLIFWLHLSLLALFYVSPFLFSWKLIFGSISIYYFQLLVFGSCLLTKKQFNGVGSEASFNHYYLTKLGFSFDRQRLGKVLNVVIPWSIFILAVFWQVLVDKHPLFF